MADLIGEKFGLLTVLERTKNEGRFRAWICLCECGEKIIKTTRNLRRCKIPSCGCLLKKLNRRRKTTHGDSQSSEYKCWLSMKYRCFNENCDAYQLYGGRGITVCNRWKSSYKAFLEDMGRKPSPEHSLDRIDNDGPYSPENCRWATQKTQSNNRRSRWRAKDPKKIDNSPQKASSRIKSKSRVANLSGQKFGLLTVIERSENQGRSAYWDCLCECGGIITKTTTSLRRSKARPSCGCLTEKLRGHGKSTAVKLIGQEFGLLTVIKRRGNKGAHAAWECLCRCGNIRTVRSSRLLNGGVHSCGCMGDRVHGKSKDAEYHSWAGMKQRCYNPNHHNYERYGGRGIIVCERWINGPRAFFEDMGPKPSPEHSLDRIDNDGPYSPENCRWATQKTQSNNRRSNVTFSHNGETLTLAEWGERLGLDSSTIAQRLKAGYTDPDVILGPSMKGSTLLTHNGETRDLKSWAEKTGIKYSTLYQRYQKGWSPEEILCSEKKDSKLSDEDVLVIFDMLYDNISVRIISEKFDVAMTTIYSMLKGNGRKKLFDEWTQGKNLPNDFSMQKYRGTKGVKTHNKSNTTEYRSLKHVKEICHNPNNRNWDRYGGRGIIVCERWKSDFDNFFEDMGPKPSPKHILTRIDNDGPYSPENCRWATKRTKQR